MPQFRSGWLGKLLRQPHATQARRGFALEDESPEGHRPDSPMDAPAISLNYSAAGKNAGAPSTRRKDQPHPPACAHFTVKSSETQCRDTFRVSYRTRATPPVTSAPRNKFRYRQQHQTAVTMQYLEDRFSLIITARKKNRLKVNPVGHSNMFVF